MSLRIDTDVNRFKDIVKGKIKNSLDKLVSSEHLISQNGSGKKVKIPLHTIGIPRFIFGSRQQGGVGQGSGDIGDGLGGEKGKKPGEGAGDDEGDHDFSQEFTHEELADILREHLQLPKLEPKSKGEVHSEKSKYNKITNIGSESLKHFRRTYKEALKNSIAAGTYNPSNPIVVPNKEDRRYKSFSTKETPEISAVLHFLIDCSGSMDEEHKHIAKSIAFWIDLLLRTSYPKVEHIYIAHDTEAQEVSREEFFGVSSGGGTKISSGLKLCSQIIEERYSSSTTNNYVFYFGDGDNSSSDDDTAGNLLENALLPNCNMFCYGQIKAHGGEFLEYMGKRFGGQEKVNLAAVNDTSDILKAIKTFFSNPQ